MPNAASRWRRSSGKLEALGIRPSVKSIYRDYRGCCASSCGRAPTSARRWSTSAWEHRAFAFAELQLLVDAVQSSRFLTQCVKSDALVEGVTAARAAGQARAYRWKVASRCRTSRCSAQRRPHPGGHRACRIRSFIFRQ